jgi:CubicO group peptidase (beta-lactamase class C family)
MLNFDAAEPEKVGLSSSRLERIGPVMQTYVDSGKIAGLSTLIARRGRIIYFNQVGLMDIKSGAPMSPDTIFRIYSMTKPIICVALMTLYEQGRFQLSDPVMKFLPIFEKSVVLECDARGDRKEVKTHRPITIHDLFTHTAGLTYDFLEDSPVCEFYRRAGLLHNADRTLKEFVEDLAGLPLAFQPGSRWHYSLAIDVLAHLIEVISDQPLAHFLEKTLFNPLGMTDTNFYVRSEKRARIATMYGLPDLAAPDMTLSKLVDAWENGFNERIDVSATYPDSNPESFARGGHGLFSTVLDYVRFAQMLLNGGELEGSRILGRKTVELMHTNHLSSELLPFKVADPPEYGYGFGLGSRVLLNVAESQKPGSVGEYGWGGAAKTYYWVDPREEMIGILMAQSMMQFDAPEKELQVLAYQALID